MNNNHYLDSFSNDQLAEELLKRGVRMGKLSFAEFILALRMGVVANVELVITNSNRDFLMTRREGPDFIGWHFPGSMIWPDETLEQTCRRIAKDEVGVDIAKIRLNIDLNMPRDPETNFRTYKGVRYPIHGCGIVCVAAIASGQLPDFGIFFKSLPPDTTPTHREIFNIYQRFLKTGYTVSVAK